MQVSNSKVSSTGESGGASAASRKAKRHLPPSEKYELWVSVLTGQSTQGQAASKYKVDRSTVVTVCRTAKQGALDALAASRPGRRGMSPEQLRVEELEAEVERLRSTVTEQAVALHLHQGKSRWD